MEKDLWDLMNEIDEEFANNRKRHRHSRDHVLKLTPSAAAHGWRLFPPNTFSNDEEYEKAADELANSPLGGNIIGYQANNGELVKYDKSKWYFVSYIPDSNKPSGNLIKTFFYCSPEDYEHKKSTYKIKG